MSTIIIPKDFSEIKRHSHFKAIKLTGMLLLERCPRDRKFDTDFLAEQFPAAMQEFKDHMFLTYGILYEQPDDMQTLVVDDILRYLERKGALS